MSFVITYRKPRSHSKGADSTFSGVPQRPRFPRRQSLLAFDALPEWCQENPYIQAGYRPISNSWQMCAQSCTSIHNETLNILTHLVPAIILAIAQVSIQGAITYRFPEATLTDRVVIGSNILAAIITFSLSALYHTLNNHSMQVSQFFLKVDFIGILVLIFGSFISGIYVGFYCQPGPRLLYWSMIFVLSVITACLVIHPDLQGPKYRPHRTRAFIATALTGFAPITHGLYLYGWNEMWTRSGMPYWFLEGIIYMAGAFFFATHFPECVWPGKFDIWLNSHTIFHVLVVMASLVHMYGVWSAYGWNYEHSRTCSVSF